MLMHGNISLFVGLKSERLKSERLNTEKHLYPFGVQRIRHMALRRHLVMILEGYCSDITAASHTVVKKLLQKAKDLGMQVIFVNIVPRVLTWRIFQLIESKRGEEKILFCLSFVCTYCLSCYVPPLISDQLNYWSWRKIDGTRKQNKTCGYVFSSPLNNSAVLIFTRWDGSGCIYSLARNFVYDTKLDLLFKLKLKAACYTAQIALM